jgi:hypothetical protein
MADGRVTAPGPEIPIREGTKLGTGAWAHDSSGLAAFAEGDDGLGYVYISPAAPDPVVMTEGGEASNGPSVWSPENDSVVFQRYNGDELEAVYCVIETPTCDVVLTWTTGIALLRIE